MSLGLLALVQDEACLPVPLPSSLPCASPESVFVGADRIEPLEVGFGYPDYLAFEGVVAVVISIVASKQLAEYR